MLSTSLSAIVGFIDHFLQYIHFCFYLLYLYVLNFYMMVLSQYLCEITVVLM